MIQRTLKSILRNKGVPAQLLLIKPYQFNFSTVKTEMKQYKADKIIRDTNSQVIYDISKNQSECWNCNSRNFQSNLFICGSCQHLQDPSESITSMNYFKLFEMNLSYEIDHQELTLRYKDLQKSFHPDKFYGLRNPKIIKFSETYSTYINEAYSTLRDDLKRAEYLIDLLTHGQKADLENKIDENKNFLHEIMMERMEIEECETEEQLQEIQERLLCQQKEINSKIDNCLKQQDYQKATEYLVRMRYNQSSQQSIKSRCEQMIHQK
ncbi:Fe-S protein assembly co-chaperone HscB (macronuclear) [Tetrahymena thermophila SB210]|uniref:Fe-S protein assembly co-chaperone HscB n=1 Tax=Tetrahymena thermophila (strain SB210) TaxID=312017 RepID=Q22RS8_TETTS|nr:Fe-S protein assembly co-chaperone HscB [Tetrahymena thermophila SB210]EAR88044.1 Fe-S protein assembly co-chaperone HscB [Tetrahymena thermophila SB210]|eukprot:XP_001008289.1 Fe-S protein assembly co-chaperone HscB [Tetrahymena thermophila SB210]